jgi:hypothetical protein
MLPQITRELISRHPKLIYRNFTITSAQGSIKLTYDFFLEPDLSFSPTITIPSSKETCDPVAERIAFLIGLVELISYWKLSCPPLIEVNCGYLSESETSWWKDLYRRGLGEFFYINHIDPEIEFNFIITTPEQPTITEPLPEKSQGVLVLVGGGKDSIVTLDAARAWPDTNLAALCVNPIEASLNAIHEAHYSNSLIITRTLDPQLKVLNQMGYLNGHTPYSALLAFVSCLAAYQNRYSTVLASNETSASEGNAFINGVEINHQYSKSLRFERLFREYPFGFTCPAEYLSFLRPLNELQICAIFARQKNYHQLFRSCNREQTQKARERQSAQISDTSKQRIGWCGECPKCVFTCIALACFLTNEELKTIFGISPFDSSSFIEVASQLAGHSEHKPFECVGTYEEVRSALAHISKKLTGDPQYTLLANQLATLAGENALPIESILSRWDKQNYLSSEMEKILKKKLLSAMEGLRL